MFNKKHHQAGLTAIAQGTKFSGDAHFSGEALVGGELHGNISAADKLTIEVDGYIEGELQCKTLKVSGHFKGKLKCDKLNITATGVVEGEIVCSSMEILPGGQFIGLRIKEDMAVLTNERQAKPLLETEAKSEFESQSEQDLAH